MSNADTLAVDHPMSDRKTVSVKLDVSTVQVAKAAASLSGKAFIDYVKEVLEPASEQIIMERAATMGDGKAEPPKKPKGTPR